MGLKVGLRPFSEGKTVLAICSSRAELIFLLSNSSSPWSTFQKLSELTFCLASPHIEVLPRADISGSCEELPAIQPPQCHLMVEGSPWVSASSSACSHWAGSPTICLLSTRLGLQVSLFGDLVILMCFDSFHFLPQYLLTPSVCHAPPWTLEPLKHSVM